MKHLLLLLVLCLPSYGWSSPLEETRCCVIPERNADGSIRRSMSVLVHFQKIHPCPSTGQPYGACSGWAIDHVIPLACGGKDEISNLQWLPVSIKSAAGVYPKDRWERKIYCRPLRIVK